MRKRPSSPVKMLFNWHSSLVYLCDGKEQLRQLWERAACEEVRMIGEAGLDKLAEAPLPLQMKLFEEQVACSEELQKTLVVHCVKAWQ